MSEFTPEDRESAPGYDELTVGSSSGGRVRVLEEEVAAKDELVTALTVQLEQLAEELDRVQRTGGDRKRAGGLPTDVVEGQRKLLGDLERVVQQWEDMQAGLMLGRMEIQLTELREFIAERLDAGVRPSSASLTAVPLSAATLSVAAKAAADMPTAVELEAVTPSSRPGLELAALPGDVSTAENLPAGSVWESLKSRMLEEAPTITAEIVAAETAFAGDPSPPAAINFGIATPIELETAIDERDAYISYLLRQLRQATSMEPPPDWVSLEQAPEELCQRLETQSQRLDQMLKHAEIEMSIERARIGRAEALLRQQQEMIEKQMRRLGLKTIEEQAGEEPETTPTDRRWVRFLGLPRGK